MNKPVKRNRATLYVSLDPALFERLRTVCERMALPVSHFASLALSREVAHFESEPLYRFSMSQRQRGALALDMG